MPYLTRRLAPELIRTLEEFPCVYINGPRQAGKTTLAQMVWPQAAYVNFDDAVALAVASGSPESFLLGYNNKLILDEIQLVPELYRAIKASIDNKRAQNQGKLAGTYILTGSTNILALPKLADALVGRMIIKTLYPLAAAELYGDQKITSAKAAEKGNFLERLRKGDFTAKTLPNVDLVKIIETATFPQIRDVSEASRKDWFRSYIASLLQRDVQFIADIEKMTLLPQLLRLMAVRVGSIVNEAELARSVKENAVTIKRYRTILDLLFLTINLPPWFRNNGKRLVKASKNYLIDTNMVCHMLGRSLGDIEKSDPNLFGHLLENFVATELLKQIAEPLYLSGLYHFRTGEGKEVDFVVEFSDQKLVGIEVKSADQVSISDCGGLLKLQEMAGEDFVQGCILYRGKYILKITDKIWALPVSSLWQE